MPDSKPSADFLRYAYHHLFLPPQLPHQDDSSFKCDVRVLKILLAALTEFRDVLNDHDKPTLDATLNMLREHLNLLDDFGTICSDKLALQLRQMKPRTFLALHIRAQNAGVVIQHGADETVFHLFEISPASEAVMQTPGRLRRCFPSSSIAVGNDRMKDNSFIKAIADLLASLDQDTPEEVKPKAVKSGQEFVETRDTNSPRLVTEMFREMLHGLGHHIEAHRFYKHTRDEICWDYTLKPWRRSPSWLFLRVAVQITLASCAPNDRSETWYKQMMLYTLSSFAKLALEAGFDSDSLFTMAAKLNRRALKLSPSRLDQWLQTVNKTIGDVHGELSRRWDLLEKTLPCPNVVSEPPSHFTRTTDRTLNVEKLRAYLDRERSDLRSGAQMGGETDTTARRFELSPFCFPAIHLLKASDLARSIEGYTKTAQGIYAGSPEDISIMVLTAIELWIALDKTTVHRMPLLSDFPPELRCGLFDPLLLKNKTEMERLLRAEQYLRTRQSNAKTDSPSVLGFSAEAQSIAVRHFASSAEHQSLLALIKKSDEDNEGKKFREFRHKTQQHNDLKCQTESLDCEIETQVDENGHELSRIHSPRCKKHRLIDEASALMIEPYERSLPTKEWERQAVVFELKPIATVQAWRDTTFYLLTEVFASPGSPRPRGEMRPLRRYDALQRFVSGTTGRLEPASSTKPFAATHYRKQHIASIRENNLILENAMQYSMHSSRRRVWVDHALGGSDLSTKCAFRLPQGPWSGLQYAVSGTGHTTNEIIAEQDCAPSQLSLLEYYSFTSLRSGIRLQWRNILRELVSGNLDFNRLEVNLIVSQAIWQAGPAASTIHHLRETQLDFAESAFSISLLRAIEILLSRIRGSWQNVTSLLVLITITTKVLSYLHPHSEYVQSLHLLEDMRRVALEWFKQIREVYDSKGEALTRKDLRARAFEVALVSHLTFDVDENILEEVADNDEQVAIMSHCLVNIDEYRDANGGDSPLVRLLLHRSMRLSHIFEPILRRNVLRHPEGLDKTVRSVWSTFDRGESTWTVGKSFKKQCLTVVMTNASVVQFDLLSGRLLMNERRLSRLPDSYEKHPTFARVLKGVTVDVVPSMVPGMAYQSRHRYLGSMLHFGMTKSGQLVLRAMNHSQIFELVPPILLEGSLPIAFVRDYAHWLDLERNLIQFCPLARAFEPSRSEWELKISEIGDACLVNGSLSLIGPDTRTAGFVYENLDVLERKEHIHTFLDEKSGSLVISLPRMALDFDVPANFHQIISRQFRGMHVERNSYLGTLTGLRDRVILRSADGHSRTLIIPRESVEWHSTETHVQVKIYTGPKLNVRYHAYDIDDVLQRLVDDDSLTSKLYRCYLHVISSFCLPDSFSGKTGTEQALDILTSPSLMSPEGLSEEEVELLSRIGKFSPRRRYYPRHLKVSQTVTWSDLPALSQHPSISAHVLAIIEHAKSHQIFRKDRTHFPDFDDACESQELFARATIRDSQFRSLDYGARAHTIASDALYEERNLENKRPSQVFQIAQLVDAWPKRLDVCQDLMARMECLNKIHPAQSATVTSLGYGEKWLRSTRPVLCQEWCRLTQLLSAAHPFHDKYKVLITLSTMAYSENADMELLATLLAFATVDDLQCNSLDCPDVLDLSEGYSVSHETIKDVVKPFLRPYHQSPEAKFPKLRGETDRAWSNRKQSSFQSNQEKRVNQLVESMMRQWSNSRCLKGADTKHDPYIDLDSAVSRCQTRFLSWDHNHKFRAQISVVQSCLNKLQNEPRTRGPRVYTQEHMRLPQYICPSRTLYLSWEEALLTKEPDAIFSNNSNEIESLVTFETVKTHHPEYLQLKTLLAVLEDEDARTVYESSYVDSLSASLAQLRSQDSGNSFAHVNTSDHHVNKLVSIRSERATQCYRHLSDQLAAACPCSYTLPHASTFFWRLSSSSLLKLIASHSGVKMSQGWKERLVEYGISLTELQHARRIAKGLQDGSEILSELRDYDHLNWDPVQRPDWLLFELESDLLIRKTQIDVADAMISPSSASNSLMQLNMGEGKSSVIVPIAIAALGDGTKLTRLVILRPLAKQMLVLLTRKLGGLLGRRIFCMPVSRSVQFNQNDIGTLRKSLEDCLRLGGVLLLQPEHLLSFHLMSIEQALERSEVATAIHGLNRWLAAKSRDILDESDELLDTRDELIYAMGSQQNCDLGPERWTLIQSVLGLMQKHVFQSKSDEIQVQAISDGSVPHIRVLNDSGAKSWIHIVVDQILQKGLQGLPSWFLASLPLDDWRTFFQDPLASTDVQERVRSSCRRDEATWKRALFLRGLLAKGVLQYAFQKKQWRVDYGKDLSRTKLAVPYRAKDTPSAQSEFSHPDVAIVLTCLSYYYEHLTDDELYLALEKVFQLDDAYDEYLKWTRLLPGLPEQYRNLGGVNMRDPLLSKTVFPTLRCGKAVIDFYLSHHVFPREMKEYPHKLSSSGWDLVKAKPHPVTGFSGTNDSRALLPSSIEQHDLPQLQDTNAEMLCKLLQAENEIFSTRDGTSSQPLSVAELLDAVTDQTTQRPMRVVLDVGAQVLELSNREFCKAWLGRLSVLTTKAVVFFDECNDLSVMDRLGGVEKFITSPFARRIGECVVYLDESHTRGTDLKLPPDYRAAVTLGPGLTKDELAQACMRMRKLGRGQSVTFIASAEITKQILGCSGKKAASNIQVFDVLRWAVLNTWSRMKRSAPLWNTQRKRHMTQEPILQLAGHRDMSTSIARRLLEPEAKTIEQRYGSFTASEADETLNQSVRSKLESFGLSGADTAAFDEEQERELAPEIEQQQQKQRPLRSTPATHSIHSDVRLLIRNGYFKKDSKAFMRAFKLFKSTTAGPVYLPEIDKDELWITKDFSTTVELTQTSPKADDYLRPVNWILRPKGKSTKWNGCLIMSPFEANGLLPYIRKSPFVDLAIFSSRKSELARPLERLSYSNVGGEETPISKRLSLFLGLFSGQVYFATYDDYICLSRALGLLNPTSLGCRDVSVDGFVDARARKAFDRSWAEECAFTRSPIEFLKAAGTFMRKGSTKDRSQLGRVLAGELLRKEEFEDVTAALSRAS